MTGLCIAIQCNNEPMRFVTHARSAFMDWVSLKAVEILQ